MADTSQSQKNENEKWQGFKYNWGALKLKYRFVVGHKGHFIRST